MANYASAYTIAFENNNTVFGDNIIQFLKDVERLMNSPQKDNIVRRINGKLMRVHAYEWSDLKEDYLVIPFGKLKESNKPYGMDQTTQKLIELPEDMFDVNCLAYHARYNIALVTTNQQGPSGSDIENYLNSFIPRDNEYRIRLKPIKRNVGIEKVRNATCARSVTFALDLGRPLNDFFSEQIKEESSINSHFASILNYSKESLESRTFTVTIGLGRKKNASLDKDSLLELLDSINIDADCIKEIYVNYKDNTSTKIDTARLKENNVIYKVCFDITTSRLSSEYIKVNLEEKLTNERGKYYRQVNEYFSSAAELGGYEFEEVFDGNPVV